MDFKFPKFYEEINIENGLYQPSNIKPYNNKAYIFWVRALIQRLQSKIGITGWPAEWLKIPNVKNFFYYILIRNGYLAISKDPKLGLFFSAAKIGGKLNLYFQPTKLDLLMPEGTRHTTIGEDSMLVMLTPDYLGLGDIISYYAEKLALNDASVNTSLINSKVGYIFGAKTKSAAHAIKTAVDELNAGTGMAVYDKRIQDDPVSNDSPFQYQKLFTASDFITDKLLEAHQTILDEFDCEIGIKTTPYKKKERMVTSEADSKEEDSLARIDTWMDCLSTSFDAVNEKYGTKLKAYINRKEDPEDGTRESNPVRNGALSES